MPELPEVETTRCGLSPLLCGKRICRVLLRTAKLREALDFSALESMTGRTLTSIRRRAKYLIIESDRSDRALLIHLGMSGSLRVTEPDLAPRKHDHILLRLDDGKELRFHDPRRFGHFSVIDPHLPHRLLEHLGVEPLDAAFDGDLLYRKSRGRKRAVKAFLMDQEIVVGVGNIYATEALFLSGIHPGARAGRISRARYRRLAAAVKSILQCAIALGGTTLRDFVDPQGNGGYFRQTLQVYGKAGEPCPRCAKRLERRIIGARQSVYLSHPAR